MPVKKIGPLWNGNYQELKRELIEMAHWAEVNENNIVTRVLVVGDDQDHRGQEFLADDLDLGGTWLKTSYNTQGGVHTLGGTPFRKNYAGIGYSYDETLDAFIPPKPFPSWLLNEDTCNWNAPVEMPVEEGKFFVWNEELVNWEELVIPAE
jgi:hypothetical protein